MGCDRKYGEHAKETAEGNGQPWKHNTGGVIDEKVLYCHQNLGTLTECEDGVTSIKLPWVISVWLSHRQVKVIFYCDKKEC